MTKRHFLAVLDKEGSKRIGEVPYTIDIPTSEGLYTEDEILDYGMEAITDLTGYCLLSCRLVSLKPNTADLWLTRQRFADTVDIITGDYITGECLNKSEAWANLFNEMEAKIKAGDVKNVHKLYENAPEDAPTYCTPNISPVFYEDRFVNKLVEDLRMYLLVNKEKILGPTRNDCFDHSSERNKK